MNPAEIAMIVSELERFLDDGALQDSLKRTQMRKFLRGIDEAGPSRNPDLTEAVMTHPRARDLLELLGWREMTPGPTSPADVDRANQLLDRIERLVEAGAWSLPEQRAKLRRLLAGIGPSDPLNSPIYMRLLEKRSRRVELMRILEWRNSGEPPLRAQAVEKHKRVCPYCGKVYRAEQAVAQCPKCAKVSEIVADG